MKRLIVVIEQPRPISSGQLHTLLGWLNNACSGQALTVDSETANVSTKGALLLRIGPRPEIESDET